MLKQGAGSRKLRLEQLNQYPWADVRPPAMQNRNFDHMIFSWFLGILFSFPISIPLAPCPLLPATDSLSVYIFLHDECVISQFYTTILNEYHETYKDKKVGFIGFFPNASTKAPNIDAFAEKYHIRFPLKCDTKMELTKSFGITITPEVAVWDHRTETLIYRGRIDDSYVRVGKRKFHPQHQDLRNVIDSWVKKESFHEPIITKAIGCIIYLER
jgi:hypothetical protein